MATNKIYATPGTVTTFRGSGGDVTWAPQNEGAGKGRISNVWDRGAGSKPMRYVWRCSTRWAATPTLGDTLRLYLVTSGDGATAAQTDGGLTPSGGELTSENQLMYDCMLVGAVVSDGVDAIRVASGVVNIYSRYVLIAMWNAAGSKALTNTEGDHIFTLTEMPDDIQAAS
jgi:hypothetical protein